MSVELRLQNLSAGYRGNTVLDGVSLAFEPGAYTCILGPSGSGKSTLLYTIAGLLPAAGGRITLGDRDITRLDPGRRDVAFVFQSYALYPHLSVYENIAFPLRVRRMSKAQLDAKVRSAAELLGLSGYLKRLPRELSGGERQRVALGRALVRDPALLLLDEPLSNLDAQLRLRMRRELKGLQRELGITTLHVTHDQGEALSLGQRVAVMRAGRVEQYAAPDELLARPATLFVAGFVGSPPQNIGSGELVRDGSRWLLHVGESTAALDLAAQSAPGYADALGAGPVHFSVPLRACRIAAPGEQPADGELTVTGEATLAEQIAGSTVLSVEVDGRMWSVAAADSTVPTGSTAIHFSARDVRVYPAAAAATPLQ